MNIYTSETEYLKTEVQRLRALVRAQQITIDKLEAQPEQELVKWSDYEPDGMHHNKPAQRTRVGLTDEEAMQVWDGIIKYAPGEMRVKDFAKAIEAKLKEKNQ